MISRRWRVGDYIGSGASGSVHAVSDEERRYRNLVIKFGVPYQIRPSHADLAVHRQFMRNEQNVLIALNSGDPSLNIPTLVEYGTHDGISFIIITRFGPDIHQRWERANFNFPSSIILKICYQILQGLQRMHAKGISHGDIEEGNVLEGGQAENESNIYLIDFGLSSALTPLNQTIDIVDTLDLMLRMFSYDQISFEYGGDYISHEDWLHPSRRVWEQVGRILVRVRNIRQARGSFLPPSVPNVIEEFLAHRPPSIDRMLHYLRRSVREAQDRSE
ncbi:Protein kinase-like domain [Gracilaria domingensis]|nr:Protein kinase-like domain [Gracilaria domingensis]